ncbi:MAG: phosphoadenosine phosphosulfate reductase family protein [Clostridia bacterium]
MKHIVSFSGGKDSTAMLLKMLEEDWTIDEILFCDTGKEFPQMYDHIRKVDKYIKQKYNKEIKILKAEKNFEYYMFDHIKTRGKRKGQAGYGWAIKFGGKGVRWCTSYLKDNVMQKYLNQKYGKGNYKEYIGIAYDEPKRIKQKEYPLIKWKMTEKDCLKYCYNKGFDWGGLYKEFERVSCWCCPFKNLKELKILYTKFPELWRQLKIMDKRANNKFRKDYSIEELEQKFEEEINN